MKTDEFLLDLVLRTYLGFKCEYCGLVYKDLETLKNANPVRFNDLEKVRLVCKECAED